MKIFCLATIVLMNSICSSTFVNYRRETDPDISLNEFNQRILDEHNRLRKQVANSDKAADMFKMATDPELVALAKKHVDTCVYGHTYYSSNKYDRLGQNIYKGGRSPESIAQYFFSEREFYYYESGSCEKGKVCGHYTQILNHTMNSDNKTKVVRAETKYIGCARKSCPHFYFTSCSYGNDYKATNHPYKIRDRPCQYCRDNCVEGALCDTDYTIILPPEECINLKPALCTGNYCKWQSRYFHLMNCMEFCGICTGINNMPGECKINASGVRYNGTLSRTSSRKECQHWNLDEPHTSNYKNEDENYCRNPKNSGKRPWCYTTDPSTNYDYCDVPLCSKHPKECKVTVPGVEYKGFISRTSSGKECQKWKLDEPHTSNYKNEDGNYCRNPNQSGDMPWCYTTDPNTKWEYCAIPLCKKE